MMNQRTKVVEVAVRVLVILEATEGDSGVVNGYCLDRNLSVAGN